MARNKATKGAKPQKSQKPRKASSGPGRYDFKKAEKKWQAAWQKEGVYEPSFSKAKKPFYNLMMFPYPSAEGLHVGNMYAFTGSDVFGRFMRMQGRDVFEPIGLDGFGIHSENYAMKVGTHPAKQAQVSEKRFYAQLQSIGNGFAWKERLETYDPEYYKWTQWIFTRLFKAGLAYRKKQAVNWCPKDMTVLADEQVEGGKCERCGAEVEKRELEQWFFRITEYAERLLQNTDKLDWTEKVRIAQRNWIGKKDGIEIEYPLELPRYSGEVVFATNNLGKLERMQRLLKAAGLDITLKLPKDIGIEDFYVEEDGASVAENSEKKARALFGRTSLPILGEDSSFDIEGLDLDPVKVKRNALKGVHERKFTVQQIAERMSAYYQRIAADRGGSIDAAWHNDLCLMTPEGFALHADAIRPVTLTSKSGGEMDPYLPLRHLYIPKPTGKYPPQQTEADELLELQPLIEALQRLFTPALKVFTTRPDTNFGATFVVLAPEHPLVEFMVNGRLPIEPETRKAIAAYRQKVSAKSETERLAEGREKTGVFTGLYCHHRLTDKKLPVYISDFVLGGFGTGAVVGVPGHDLRDFEFAQAFNLPVIRVVRGPQGESGEITAAAQVQEEEGTMMNSSFLDGLDIHEATEKIKDHFVQKGWGRRVVSYRLRDWLISRQRYWGPPIPMVFCEACASKGKGERKDMPGWYSVPEKDLPVKLPLVKDFRPQGTGQSPLASVRSFYETKCPACKSKARRETDVSDTFLDSAWYYLRYPTPGDKKKPWDPKVIKKWFPVDMYIGGAEHSVLHLLYVRFLALALHDMKLLSFPKKGAAPAGEPFPTFRAHGLIIKEGAKMSKSKGNVVNPDEYIRKFGADALRMYLMFLAPFEQGGDFRDQAVAGISRFLERTYRFVSSAHSKAAAGPEEAKFIHQAVKKVGEDIASLHYNTAISAMMICLNSLEGLGAASKATKEMFVKILAPLAPHMSEELWRNTLGHKSSVHKEAWPKYDPKQAAEKRVTLVVQVNGKTRATLEAEAGLSEEQARKLALEDEKITALLAGQEPKRVIYVPGRLVNIVV